MWDENFGCKHHQLNYTLDATIVLILCTKLVYLLIIYQYIKGNNN